jgi:hypothetical protein
MALSGHRLLRCKCLLSGITRTFGGSTSALPLAAVTLVVGLIPIAADATEREHRKW